MALPPLFFRMLPPLWGVPDGVPVGVGDVAHAVLVLDLYGLGADPVALKPPGVVAVLEGDPFAPVLAVVGGAHPGDLAPFVAGTQGEGDAEPAGGPPFPRAR